MMTGLMGPVSDDEESNKNKFPYQYTKMGDLTKVYPGFYDRQFINQFKGDSFDDSAYGSANQGDQVSSIGCNDEPSDATTVDGSTGFVRRPLTR